MSLVRHIGHRVVLFCLRKLWHGHSLVLGLHLAGGSLLLEGRLPLRLSQSLDRRGRRGGRLREVLAGLVAFKRAGGPAGSLRATAFTLLAIMLAFCSGPFARA